LVPKLVALATEAVVAICWVLAGVVVWGPLLLTYYIRVLFLARTRHTKDLISRGASATWGFQVLPMICTVLVTGRIKAFAPGVTSCDSFAHHALKNLEQGVELFADAGLSVGQER
jgi:hypothetical protein